MASKKSYKITMLKFGTVETVETERLRLRAWSIEDAADLYDYAKNPNVGPHGGWKPHESVMESFSIITDLFMKAYYSWAIILKEDDRLIGSIGYEKDPRRREINCLELGYALGEDCWGKGYMTEAANAALKHGFGALRLDMVSIYRNPENKRSGRVIEKCGFYYEGTLRKANLVYNGEVRDVACYSMKKEEYNALLCKGK